MAEIRIGTCSWKYESWRGLIYPETGDFNYLEEYSKYYNTVEIDQWFWSLFTPGKPAVLPRESDVKLYAGSVPDDFRFTIKLPNSLTLTHCYRKDKKEPLTANPLFLNPEFYDQFLYSIKPLENKVGVLMLQFEYLNREKMGSQTEFMERLEMFIENIPADYKIGIEIRNPNYLNSTFFQLIDRLGLVYVFLQGYYMPPVFDVLRQHRDYIKDTAVVRLHGPDRSGIEKKSGGNWDKIIEPKDEEAARMAELVKYLKVKETDVYLNVNNHYEGSAPLTIQKIKELL